MKKNWKNAGKLLFLLLTGIVTGFVLLVAAFALPVSGMERNIRRSADAIEQENGTSSELLSGYQATYDGVFTDCLMLQNAVYQGKYNVLQAAMGIYRSEENVVLWHPADSLIGYLEGNRATEVSYARYWHGYLVILKPLLMFLNFQEIKILNMMLLGAACLAVVAEMYRRKRHPYAWAFAASVFFMVPLSAALSLSQAICAYIALGAVLFVLKKEEWILQDIHELYYFLVIGMATSYLDFLTYPVVTLGFPLVMILMAKQESGKNDYRKKIFQKTVTDCLCWGTGYVCMWASKWVISSIILGKNVLSDAAGTMAERTSSIPDTSRVMSFFRVVFENMKKISGLPYKWLAVILVFWIVYRFLKSRRTAGVIRKTQAECVPEKKSVAAAYLFTAAIPFFWYALTINHSEEHAVFTFRILGVTAFSLLCLMLKLTETDQTASGKIGN